MDWVDRMNQVVEYVEESLSEDIDLSRISKIMACPLTSFYNSFTQVTGISFAEYIRRRKLTLAAYDLQNTTIKVIDVALRYGYTSPDAFRVAFKKLHGMNPKHAKNPDVVLKFYSKLEFEINIKGVYEMDYKLVERKSFQVVGIRKITPYSAGTWAIVKSDGSLDELKRVGKTDTTLGLCFGYDEEGNNDYMCGIEWQSEDIHAFDSYVYPHSRWLVFVSEGALSDNILFNTWNRILEEFLPNSKYVKLNLPTIEKYIVWDEQQDYGRVEIQIPVKQK